MDYSKGPINPDPNLHGSINLLLFLLVFLIY